MGGEGIGQLPETVTGGMGSVDTVMIESEAGGGGGSAEGQQVPEVADAASARKVEEDERVRRAAEAAQVASGSSQQEIWVTGALMVRAEKKQAQKLAEFLKVSVHWREQRGDSYRGDFQLYKLSKLLEEAAASRAAGGWLQWREGVMWRFDVASKELYKLAATGAPVRLPAEPRMPGAPSANPWLSPNPLCRAQQPAHHPAADLRVITEAVSKEVASTVKVLLEHHRAQEMALMQAALLTAQQAAQAAQQAAEQAAAQTAEHQREIHELKMELAAVKDKMVTMKQAGASRPGEPHPPPKWQTSSEMQPNRKEKLLSDLVEKFRGGVADGKAAQLEFVGRLGSVTDKLNEIAVRLSFLEQQQSMRPRTGGPSRSMSTGQPGPAGEVAGLLRWRVDHWPSLSCGRSGR